MLASGRYSGRLYTAYSAFYILGTLMAMQIQFVGLRAVTSAEHVFAAAVFIALQVGVASVSLCKTFNPNGTLDYYAKVPGLAAAALLVILVAVGCEFDMEISRPLALSKLGLASQM